ncbi:MAG: aspartate-semialdehyde dehydrogenase [Oscillospiraceae bacterium]|jgi:aspartate-semialdehyde dehydrogenase|nr:aspartate-semialdehyde dehydrogenase [Oscillospiraceae bacterium]
MKKYNAGIIGATGMVGQRFVLLLAEHPWFNVTVLAASPRSAGKKYGEVVKDRWLMSAPVPEKYANMVIADAHDVETVAGNTDFIFCAVDMDKGETKKLEEAYAKAERPVMSNNSAHRHTPDVPMLIPEVNPEHAEIVKAQRVRLGTKRGFVAVKSNCSIQSYVPALHPLMKFGVNEVVVCTYQAISGAGKNFGTWPEMADNVIPFIGGEEEKSEKEPLKIWGKIRDGIIVDAEKPVITAQCIRVPVTDGHMAAVFVKFDGKPSKEEIINLWNRYGSDGDLRLPSAPEKFLTYFGEDSFPQTKLHRDLYGGMGVSIGRLREDALYDYKFVCLSHNTLRGAAGGAVLMAELFADKGYFD